jgi:predicted Zn-dependent protease
MKSKLFSARFLPTIALGVALAAASPGVAATRTEQKPDKNPAAKSPLLTAMEQELERSLTALRAADPPAYFISYNVTEQQRSEVQGSNGALLSSQEVRNRWLETTVRAGSYELDDTHKVGGRDSGFQSSFGTQVPVDNDAAVLLRAIWLETDRQYRGAAEALLKIKTGRDVKVETAEGRAPDFSREKPQVWYGPHAAFQVDRRPWEEKVRRYTDAFRTSPSVLNSIVTFSASAQNEYVVNSEGTRLQFGDVKYRLELYIQGKAPDGMDINRYANFDWTDAAAAPDDQTVLAGVNKITKELEALVAAPIIDPYAGPALLTGRAAAVFFHEVFGHRAEGHRQKDVNEGQTFTRNVGEKIFPDFLSVYDDPTRSLVGRDVLLGKYPFDDEGVPAERVTLVDHGVLRNFLMSRSPLIGFPVSNGHGRRQVGLPPVSRQGNLIVESSNAVSDAELRKKLVEEIKRQGKPFGLLIDDIAGGFTFTGRGTPQAFAINPLVVFRVYADGRPDELVRGADIVGTPRASLAKILATGDKAEVFNGYCGAESGSIPVAAVSPAILISELEISKKEQSTDRPPLLPPPAHDPQAAPQAEEKP